MIFGLLTDEFTTHTRAYARFVPGTALLHAVNWLLLLRPAGLNPGKHEAIFWQ